jgi:hypothetical protein
VPPLLAYGSQVRDETFVIAPGVWHSADAQRADTVVFPFYWRFADPTFDATVVSGVWWDFKWPSEAKRLLIATPLYINWVDPEESFHIVGPVSWSRGRGEQAQAWSFHVVPFASVWSYHPDHIKWRALLFVAGYEREYDKRQILIMGVKSEPE